jgi:hypothetical protein
MFVTARGEVRHYCRIMRKARKRRRACERERKAEGKIVKIRNILGNLGIVFVLVGCLSARAAVVSWDGGGDGATWQDANNWSGDQLPGTTSDVVISIPGTNFTVVITANAFVRSLQCDHSLSVSNGTLRVTGGASRVNGTLTVAGRRTLEVNGAGATFVANGPVQLDGAALLARGGATLSLPTLTRYVESATCCGATLEASGAGSVLDLSNVTNVIGHTVISWDTVVQALTGGEVRLGSLKRVEAAVFFHASGANAVVRVPVLDDFAGNSGRLTLQALAAGEIQSGALTRANRTRFIRRSGGVLPIEQITTLNLGSITADGVMNLNMGSLTNVDGAELFAQNGAKVTFPAVRTYTDTAGCCGRELVASGSGSMLNFPVLTNFTGNPVGSWHTFVQASSGGRVELTNLARVSAAFQRWSATGSNSVINATGLTAFDNDVTGELLMDAGSGGAVVCPGLTDCDRVGITLNAGGSIPLTQIRTLAHGGLSLFAGQSLTLSTLTNIDGAELILKSNTVLSLPSVTSFEDINGCCGQLWQVTGAGSGLELPSLTQLKGNPVTTWQHHLEVFAGGRISAPNVPQLVGGSLQLLADGTNSTLHLPQVNAFAFFDSNLEVRNGGQITFTGGTLVVTNARILIQSGGALLTGGLQLYAGAKLSGSGAFNGTVVNAAGEVRPGTSPGRLTINGNYMQGSAGKLVVEVGGTAAGSGHDVLAVNGAVALDGTLQTSLVNGFVPNITNTFTVLTATSVTGDFSAFSGLDAGSSLEFVPQVNAADVKLSLAFSTGPSVISLTPTGTVENVLSTFTVVFSEALTSSTFGTNDIVLTGPAGAIPVTSLQRLAPATWRLVFASQINQGNYTLTIGPNVNDLAGNPMNQDGDGVNGEASDVFSATVFLKDNDAPRVLSMVPSGHVNSNVASLAITFSEPVVAGSFTLADIAVSGPAGTINPISLTAGGGNSWVVALPNQSVEGLYTVVVGPNILDAQSLPMAAAFQGTFTIDRGGPRLLAMSPSSGVTQAVSWVELTFSESILASSLSSADGTLIGPAGAITLGSVTALSSNRFRLFFPSQTLSGVYTLTIGPNVTDLAGNLMDQDSDGNKGEPIQDVFTGQFSISSPDLAITEVTVPASGLPGQAAMLVWTVTNRGSAAVTRAITEVVSMSGDGIIGADLRIASFLFTNTLPPATSLTRTQNVVLPPTGPAGALHVVVETDANRVIAEENETNNAAISVGTLNVPLALAVQLTVTNISEGASPNTFSGQVLRNGELAGALIVNLTSSDLTEVVTPDTVVIPAGQSVVNFTATVIADGIPDGPQSALLTAAASGYQSGGTTVTVLDADAPALGLSLTNASLVEGQLVMARLSRDGDLSEAVAVTIGSSSPGQINMPHTVTLGAGVAAIDFGVLALDDGFVERTRNYTITASAPGYESAAAALTIADDDLPVLMVSVDRASINEGAGPSAATLSIARSFSGGEPFTVDIVRSHTSELNCAASVTFAVGELVKLVPLSAVDDLELDGDRNVTLTVFALESLALARIEPGVSTSITVLDNDGPRLDVTLERNWLCLSNAAFAVLTGTVTRNTALANALTVNLSVNFSSLTVPAIVQIPPGAASANFVVQAVASGAGQITASAAGFGSGSATVTIQNGCAPDLVIASIAAPPSGVTEAFFSVNYREENIGAAFSITNRPPGITNILQNVFASLDPFPGGDELLGSVLFDGSVSPYTFLERSATFRLPKIPGDYWIIVQADGSNAVNEIDEGNNFSTSPSSIHVDPAYTATVAAGLETGTAGTPVPLSGFARKFGSSQPAPFELVSITIEVRGTRRVIAALTDQDGNFATTFVPLPGEAGVYSIFASHPGITNAPAQDTFTLVGMRFDPATLEPHLLSLTTVTQEVFLENSSDVPLTGLSPTLFGTPAELAVMAGVPSTVAGFARVPIVLVFQVTTDVELSPTFTLRVTSAEGAVADLTVSATIESLRPRLQVTPATLAGGVVPGGQKFVEFSVLNLGGAPTGPLNVLLPAIPFLSLASVPTLSLNPGESNTVVLQLLPPPSQPLGEFHGNLVLASATASQSVPFSFRVLSTNTANVRVEVVDEFTYYAEGAPRVTNALVELRDAVTRSVVAAGISDAAGLVVFSNIVEGYYLLEASAEDHAGYRQPVFVTAGSENFFQPLLSREVVKFYWNVVPTELGDRTRITIESVFETVVPIPVLTVSPSVIDFADFPNGGTINLTVTNHGLLAAQNVRIGFSPFDCWRVTPLISDLGTLAARSSLVVPVTICHDPTCTRSYSECGSAAPSANLAGVKVAMIHGVRPHGAGGGSGSGCGGGSLRWEIPCGLGSSGGSVPIGTANAGDAGCGGPWKPHGDESGGGSLAGGGSSSSGPCDPCGAQLLVDLTQCGLNFLPSEFGCVKGVYDCIQAAQGTDYAKALRKCVAATVDCLIAAGREGLKPLDLMLDLMDCADQLKDNCKVKELIGSLDPGGSAGQNSPMRMQSLMASNPEYSYPGLAEVDLHSQRAAAVLQVYESYFGDRDWLRSGAGPVLTDWLEQFRDATATNSVDAEAVSSSERATLLAHDLRNFLPEPKIGAFLDRWNLTVQNYNAGVFDSNQIPPGGNTNFIVRDWFTAHASAAAAAINASQAEGYADVFLGLSAAINQLRQIVLAPHDGVCAQVRIRIDQEAVIARDAFKATLEIENNSGTPLESITVDLLIFNEQGQDSTGLFALPAPALSGLAGVNGEGPVPPGTTGRAVWSIIPTSEAAPGTTQTYYVSGSLRYIQDGVAVTVPLSAAPITVHPLAELHLTYFHQRDVLGDDPFTDEIEPSVPFSLAVMVRNSGDGVARNVRITSSQPEIVDNDKGLLVDFDIIATEVAGQNLAPSLTANFGDVNPGQIKIGQWLLKSTLQGLFIQYDATFEHLDGLGDPRLSLVQSVDIHELIHIVRAPGVFEDGLPDMLVNDFADIEDLPDALYLSDGSIVPVSIVTTGSVSGAVSAGSLTVQLSANLPAGWSYLRVPDPGNGNYRLVSVTRSNNVPLSLGTNVWLTDRTFIGGGLRPVKENNLHLLDYNSSGVYTLVYALPPIPDTTAPVSSVAALPSSSFVEIAVQWSGNDETNGSGLAAFDIYVSEDGGSFVRWLEGTTARGAVYAGALGHAYAFYSAAIDNAGNRESPPGVPDASTTVNLVNSPPSLVTGADQTVDEGATVVINNSASDSDSPAQSLTFSLGAASPPGATINPLTGRVTWRTGEGTGLGTNDIFVVVKDNGVPSSSTTGIVHVVVNEVNSAPMLAPIALRHVNEGMLLSFNVTATDPDLPANTLFYMLGPAPPGTAINPLTGAFSWRPGVLQGPSTNHIEVIVMDNGVPPLSATQVVQIIVHDAQGNFLVAVGSTNVFAGESSSVPIDLLAGENLARLDFNLSGDELRLSNLLLAGARPEIASVSLAPAGSNQSVLTFVAATTQSLPAGATLAQFNFQTTTNGSSAFIPLQPTLLSAELLNGTALTNGFGRSGRIVFIHDEPLLEALRVPPALTLWGHPLQSYTLECSTNLLMQPAWGAFTNVTLTNASRVVPVPGPNRATFYRAVGTP